MIHMENLNSDPHAACLPTLHVCICSICLHDGSFVSAILSMFTSTLSNNSCYVTKGTRKLGIATHVYVVSLARQNMISCLCIATYTYCW